MDIRWRPDRLGFNADLLTYQTALRAAVPDDALCIAGSDESRFIFFYYIDKKGWAFDEPADVVRWLPNMIQEGARYLYTDRIDLLDHDKVKPFLGELLLKAGSIHV